MLSTFVDPVKSSLDASGATRAIQRAVDVFVDNVPVFMKALDEVAKIHPFITSQRLLL